MTVSPPKDPTLCTAGEPLLFTMQLTAGGVLTDPSAGAFSYGIPGQGLPTVVSISDLTHTGNGTYTFLLDTTNLNAGVYVAQILAEGAVWSTDFEIFIVQARPLG